MAGRFREEDIAAIREKVRIDELIGEYVTLRNAGGGSSKGLCPFHDEKTPSFYVTPARGFFHCFGCQETGDAFSFLMKMDGLSFVDAVERLSDRVGLQVRREEGDGRDDRPKGPPRQRLIEANRAAQEFYAEQLNGPDAVVGRQFLHERGFDQAAAQLFGVGFAPRDGEALLRHLRGRKFRDEEIVAAGLVKMGRSAYDAFRGRLVWPIRESSGATIGFGARRLFDDDRNGAKYLNTTETTLYKKSQVLYGIDLARQAIGRESRAVVVEGYTDVMACHLAGITTAVASCGTAFGDEHIRVLRRFLHDDEGFRGEVIFTFDGDAAGQAAAMKAFAGDQRFVSQTYVAVQPEGLDPCDLRLRDGDEAVRALVGGRVPLYRFVLANVVGRYDLDRADGRIDALREGARLVSSVRDRAKVDAFARELAGMVGVDVEQARAEVRRAERRGPAEEQPRPTAAHAQPPAEPAPAPVRLPDPRDPRFMVERETLKLALQHPMAIGRTTADVRPDDFAHPLYRAVWRLVEASGGTVAGASDAAWVGRVRDASDQPVVQTLIGALAVEPLQTLREPDAGYVVQFVVRLQELAIQRRIEDARSRLQRIDFTDDGGEGQRVLAEVAALEQQRRTLRERFSGGA
ncbi:DNA primase [Nocardioides sp. R-C-SC26]|uniref:DNA primase n=1 Tax=Nocardioides sp. R-C-SC26 TaxID=2870414 RepID=UPI001E5DC43E|nr:DNA primase [Nocardioides sp. R-C-SC26]